MILGIMQPYLFPYIGYFALIDYVDKFVFFDTPQYIRKGWINRNRILKANGVPDYFTVPVKKCNRETAIKDVAINQDIQWKEKIYGQLTAYKRKAPHYDTVIKLIREVFDGEEKISDLSIKSVITSCRYIGIDTCFDIFSKMNITIESVNEPDEWALEISKAMGYESYVNPPGGMSFFDRGKYERAGINLQFLEAELKKYNQRIGRFEPGLSIIDMMMFLKPMEIKQMLSCYILK